MPIYVRNNGEGADAEALKRFDEPAWNNPVVRFLDARGRDVIERRDGVWSTAGIARRMTAALTAAEAPVPTWLVLAELDARRTELPRVVLAMHCFWEGQAKLGGLAGVADARPAFLEGLEVVDVRYDPERTPLAELLDVAERAGLAKRAWIADERELVAARKVLGDRARPLAKEPDPAPASDDLRALKRSPVGELPLSRTQAVRLNAEIGTSDRPRQGTLSPRQTLALEASNAKTER
ncbi:MAG: hypothetical protein IPJ77_22945 [Planctomycetes bacterium]|nr:hypothetical protein [Planctomycetota bacterium]